MDWVAIVIQAGIFVAFVCMLVGTDIIVKVGLVVAFACMLLALTVIFASYARKKSEKERNE